MRLKRILGVGLVVVIASAYALLAAAQQHQHAAPATQSDSRQLVKFPEPMRLHTITSMSTPNRTTNAVLKHRTQYRCTPKRNAR